MIGERLEKLISDTKMVGEFFSTAVTHPCNYPELESIDSLNGVSGLVVACNLRYRQTFLFHESQMQRVIR